MFLLELATGTITDLGIQGQNPLWSPDGREIGFVRVDSFDSKPPTIMAVTADGTTERTLVPDSEGNFFGAQGSWSPCFMP